MMVRDPVCGMEIDPDSAEAETEYNGQTYYFCSQECRQEFEDHPERYVPESSTQRRPSNQF